MSLDTTAHTATSPHPAWLPPTTLARLGDLTTTLDIPPHLADHPVITTLRSEITHAAHNATTTEHPGRASATTTTSRTLTLRLTPPQAPPTNPHQHSSSVTPTMTPTHSPPHPTPSPSPDAPPTHCSTVTSPSSATTSPHCPHQ